MDKINGIALGQFGATLLAGYLEALMAPTSLKAFIENDDKTQNGTQILVTDARLAERDVTLSFLLQGNSTAEFTARYTAFLQELYKGQITLYVEALDLTFRLIYSNTTQFNNYQLHACKLAVKFREPNPADRTNE